MDRLTQQLARLYFVPGNPETSDPAATSSLTAPVEPGEKVRMAVMGIRRPADWRALALVWQGIQDDFSLPPPAIAVNGSDALCLWFSFDQAVSADVAKRWLNGLQHRYLPTIDQTRLVKWPAGTNICNAVPAPVGSPDHWSAFVTAGMVSVFSDEPWLEQAPNPEAQADLLSGLKPMPVADVEAAMRHMTSGLQEPSAARADHVRPTGHGHEPEHEHAPDGGNGRAARQSPAPLAGLQVDQTTWTDPKAFLLAVMNDPAAPLSLRLDAAKSLLPLARQTD